MSVIWFVSIFLLITTYYIHIDKGRQDMAYENTTQRVLDIPEIIELIMSFLDKKDNIQNACVCKRWCEIALDCVWRNADDITQLLRLLAPLDTPLAIPPLRYYVSAMPSYCYA